MIFLIQKNGGYTSEKTQALTMMINEHVNPSVFQRNEANRLMCDGKLYFKYIYIVSLN